MALEIEFWKKHWTVASWREYLNADRAEADAEVIRQSTHIGRPLGTPQFIEALEKAMRRQLVPKKGGRPAKSKDTKQESLSFD